MSEVELIENRLGLKLHENDKLCAFHRFDSGIGWIPPRRCLHPHHKFEKGKKSPACRAVPLDKIVLVNKKFNATLPVGAKFCFKHYKEEIENKDNGTLDNSVIYQQKSSTPNKEEFEPEEICIAEEITDIAYNSGVSLTQTLETSPLTYQIKRKRVSDLADETKQKLKRKFERAQKQLKKKFAEAIAPGQSSEFIDVVLDSKNEEIKDKCEIPEELLKIKKIYEESDSISSLIVLATVDHEKYSKQDLMKVFGVSKYKIDQARKFRKENDGFKIPATTQKSRVRMDISKAEHFLEFLFSSGTLQDVAYGTTKIKFESGEEQRIAHAIITSKFSHTIAFYKKYCDSINYQSLSNSSLWRILNGIGPSQRKCLAGLDDITAAAMSGFQTLINTAEQFKRKDLTESIERGKRYLKTQFQLNCSDHSSVMSHNITFALSTKHSIPKIEFS